MICGYFFDNMKFSWRFLKISKGLLKISDNSEYFLKINLDFRLVVEGLKGYWRFFWRFLKFRRRSLKISSNSDGYSRLFQDLSAFFEDLWELLKLFQLSFERFLEALWRFLRTPSRYFTNLEMFLKISSTFLNISWICWRFVNVFK